MKNECLSRRIGRRGRGALVAVIAVGMVGFAVLRGHAQSLSYTSGQPVFPAYEGWEEGPDGAKYFLFGYMNRNWEEEVDVPVGADNGFDRGGADQGQPTHFLPRRNRFVFRVPVPADFTEQSELIWTLTANGRTVKAYASLRPDYKVDDVAKASETGALGAGASSPTIRANKPPIVKIEGSHTVAAKVGQPVSLVATVTDDGVPKAITQEQLAEAFRARARAASGTLEGAGNSTPANPPPAAGTPGTPAAIPAATSAARTNPALAPPSRATVGKNLGLHVSWFVYRGPGKATFTPAQIKPWEDTRAGANSPWAPLWFAPPLPADGKLVTEVTFSEPGTYTLRALADDGALTGGEDLTVTVTP